MVGRKLFKTKLCQLYQRGCCHRQACSFAHGKADIRLSFDHHHSFTGWRDHEGKDLRETLERRRSPVHRYSSVKDHRGRHSSHGGNSPRALSEKNDLKHQKKQVVEGDSYSSQRSPLRYRIPNDKRQGIPDSGDVLGEQLTELKTEIDMLLGHKRQLELYIQEYVEEAAGLTSIIEELEGQLDKDKEESKRIISKIKKFIKAYRRHSRLQDELKRSYDQLQKQMEMFCSDVSGPGARVEDPSNNISSDKECSGHILKRGYVEQHNILSSRKRVRILQEANKASNQDNGMLGDETKTKEIRAGKLSQVDVHHAEPDKSKKMKLDDQKNGCRSLISEDNNRRGINISKESKLFELELALPSTSMAAHPVDEVEIVDTNENIDVEEDYVVCKNEVPDKVPLLSFLPPPPPTIPHNAYSQYKGNDESVDQDGIDEETADVDID